MVDSGRFCAGGSALVVASVVLEVPPWWSFCGD